MSVASLMARIGRCDTGLVFHQKASALLKAKASVEIYPVKHFIHGNNEVTLAFPLSWFSLNADVVHIHQINTLISDLETSLA
jgi:hypothetical protein